MFEKVELLIAGAKGPIFFFYGKCYILYKLFCPESLITFVIAA